MATLYDKKGKEYKVPHAVDVKEWLDNGFLKEKPKSKTRQASATKEETHDGTD